MSRFDTAHIIPYYRSLVMVLSCIVSDILSDISPNSQIYIASCIQRNRWGDPSEFCTFVTTAKLKVLGGARMMGLQLGYYWGGDKNDVATARLLYAEESMMTR